MEEFEDPIAIKVQALSDLELAVLICLVADQHCIIDTEQHLVKNVEEELRLVSRALSGDLCHLLTLIDRKRCVRANMRCTELY